MLTMVDIDFIVTPQYRGYKGLFLNLVNTGRAKHFTEMFCGVSNPQCLLALLKFCHSLYYFHLY